MLQRTLRAPRFAVMIGAALLSGCFLHQGGGGALVSSASSDYSPVVTFRANVRVTDSVRVQIDRLQIISPGEVFEGSTAGTGRMEMQALLVTPNPNLDGSGSATPDRNGTNKPWLERSASAAARVADSLFMGVPQTTGPLHFVLAMPADVDRSKSWLVYRITGPAKAMAARMADGSAPPDIALPAIRVFACSLTNLDGRKDKAREKIMKEMYSLGC